MKNNVMSAALLAAVASSAGSVNAGQYLAGDFHNHTTCSDGSTSVKTLTRKSLTYLDWFIHVGHSGSGSRDCRVDDFLYINRSSGDNAGLWVNTIGEAGIKGDSAGTRTMSNGDRVPRMWRWQSLQEFEGGLVEERNLPANKDKTAFVGLEWVVPGHEHTSASISKGQYGETPNTDAIAQFEYCFAANSNDTSQGGGQGWTCELSEQDNNKLKALFNGRPEEGVADYNSTLVGGVNINDSGDHVKSTAAILWMQEHYPEEAFAVESHVERQGAFISADDEGYNVEHMRDWNTVAPDIAFGFESQPGHQAVRDRGSYNAGRPTSGLWTFGGTGCYGAAEAAIPGFNFDGTPLTTDYLSEHNIGGGDPAKVTLCRPGVRTMWDAMLSEGRHFWFFASSDWHSRGNFGPLDYESTSDFWPGEYQQNFVYVEDTKAQDPAKEIVKSLRSGNSFTVQGQLISGDFTFKACSGFRCATMGETLTVRKGAPVRVEIELIDPAGANNSPYKFNNPSLLQIGQEIPLNEPFLAQVDLIKGVVGKQISPSDSQYYNPMAPATTVIAKTWTFEPENHGGWEPHPHHWGWDSHDNHWGDRDKPKAKQDRHIKLSYWMRATEDSYVRLRGNNIPAGTPNERDAYGNPLPDNLSDNIPCDDAACPAHINGYLDADVEAWADIWFHANPIFIDVK